MARIGLLYIWFYALLRSGSVAYFSELIVGRAEAKDSQTKKLDFFIYTNDSSCNYTDFTTPWCKQYNAEPLSTVSVPGNKKCKCQCKWDTMTFLLDERRCVNDSYLESRFGSGKSFLNYVIKLMGLSCLINKTLVAVLTGLPANLDDQQDHRS